MIKKVLSLVGLKLLFQKCTIRRCYSVRQRNEKYTTQTLIVNHVGLKAWVCKLTLGRTCKFRYKGRGVQGGGGGTPPRSFWYVAVFWSPSWSLPRIRNLVKTARNGNFLCFKWQITHKQALCMILATIFTFIVERSWKNMYFHPKLAWPPATSDVIYRNHSNWPSLNLSQNVREGLTNWKRLVLTFYPLGKNSEKPYGWVVSIPPLYVRGLSQ